MNLATPPPKPTTANRRDLHQSASTHGAPEEFKPAHRRPISAPDSAPQRRAVANHQPGGAKTQSPANARAPHGAPLRQWARPGAKGNRAAGPAARFESNVRRGPGRRPGVARANQRRRLAAPERWDTRPRPALLWVLSARPRPRTTAVAGRRRRARAQGGLRGPRGRSHVGEHGGAAAPGHDQPVRAGRGLRGRPGEAAAAGGALAVRDRPERVFPRKQHSQQPPPPADDVYSQQHPSHTTELPRRLGHVLEASYLRGPAEQQQPHDGSGLLTPCKLQPLLGLIPTKPPGILGTAFFPQFLPSPPLPTAHVAPGASQGGTQQKAMTAMDGQR